MLDMMQETARRLELFKQYQLSEEYQKKLVNRARVTQACSAKQEARELTYALCARPDNPAEGCIFFIENFGWTFDPRPQADPHDLPFILYDYQKDAIRSLFDSILNGKDLLFEKSRDMGASWLIFCYVPLWMWLFKDGTNFLIGSYKEDLVDNRTKDSLFGMIDYAVQNLPKWILPKGFKIDKHRNQMKLMNPANGNQITGDTMNPDFGRGSRKTAILFDELGSWEYAKEAWESASQATACRIANSTPKGYNFYAMLRDQRQGKIDIHSMHWRQHPLKDEQWYEFEKARNPPETIAQELDISYTKSMEGRVYPEWSDESVVHGDYEYDPNSPLYISWDFGMSDDTAIIWAQKSEEGKLRIVDVYKNSNKHIEFFIPIITGMISMDFYAKHNYQPTDLAVVERHKNWRGATHFGDPSGRFITQASDHSVFDILKVHGIVVNFRDEWKGFQKRKLAAKKLIMGGIEVNQLSSNTLGGITRDVYFDMCMTQSAYPKVRRGGTEEVNSVKPVHNWTSHYRSAFEYLALGLEEYRATSPKPRDKFKPGRFSTKRALGY